LIDTFEKAISQWQNEPPVIAAASLLNTTSKGGVEALTKATVMVGVIFFKKYNSETQ